MDNAYVTWKDVTLVNNSAAFSVFDLWFGDAWIEQADVIGNQVQSGSIWNFESFRGRFENVSRCLSTAAAPTEHAASCSTSAAGVCETGT